MTHKLNYIGYAFLDLENKAIKSLGIKEYFEHEEEIGQQLIGQIFYCD